MKRWSIALTCLAFGIGAGWYVSNPLLRGQVAAPPALLAAPVPREPISFRDVVKKVLPAVVSIDAKAGRPQPRRTEKPTPDEPYQLGLGSGFLVDPKGVIVTNFHVVEGADRVEVTLADGRKFVSRDVKADPKTDLAIVRIETKEALPFLRLGDSDAMEIGDRVLAVGAPFGLTGSVTSGIVSAKSRSLRINMYEDFIQTDAAINPGNSGGPLVNLDGEVIGINSAIKSRSGGFQGVGLAIASNLVRNVTDQLLRDGLVRRGYLGIQIKEVDTAEAAAKLGLDRPRGVLVTYLYDNGPATRAGIRTGDVLLSLNGRPVADSRELQRIVAGLPLGKPVDVTLLRAGKSATLRVTIEEQPGEFGSQVAPPRELEGDLRNATKLGKLGFEASDLKPDTAGALGFRQGARGALIVRVQPGGVAAQAGLRPGMLITRVEKQAITTTAGLTEALNGAALEKGVLLQVQSPQGGTNFVLLKSGE